MTPPDAGHPREGQDQPGEPPDGPARFARIWSRAVYPATATSMTRPEFEAHLLGLTRTLAEALHARPFDPSPGRGVGEALVAAHCTAPDSLPRILGVLDAYLLLYCLDAQALPAEEARARCARLQHAIAAGFSQALQNRTRTEQEALSRAALQAQTDIATALHESETRFRAVFNDAALGIGLADMDGNILETNRTLSTMFGGSEHHIRSRNVTDWTHPEDFPETWRLQGELMRGERDHYSIEKPYNRSDGTVLWTNLTVSLLRDADGEPQYMLAMMEDITERRLLNLRLRYQATHDALTDLPNRALFFERLEQALGPGSECARIGLCYLDLDGFKAVNDSLGHAVGDQLLIAVAERLHSCVSGPRQLLARIGGDEFVALITDPPSRATVTELAERALDVLSEPVDLGGRELMVRASIGIVEGPVGDLTASEVLRSADITMYRAKSEGGNRYAVADPDSEARAISRHHLTHHLPSALRGCEFFIEYQPLIRMEDGSIEGAEALVRWSHPRHGVLGPDRFIPLAEHTGLIVPLGRWVLREAVRQACEWQVRGIGGARPLRVNVNLSPRQLHHPDLVDETVAVLEEFGLPAGSLCLEVTESAMVRADDHELKPLRQLAELGVGIALDDFGTGYSNLASLRRLPASTLKLDRSFTEGLQHHPPDPVDLRIVEGIVSLSHTLGLSVTVEGVETGLQAERLKELGCDSAQGWFYARPGPPEKLPMAV
ncbi:putative bifunctional diguanylate cyclase/phosphodiesterase [Streptomyces aidingensis]|uniref:PAS domain S-box-containing protein/diguanylate cyclase (GGDEF) domain-containing protein n=1 Tax=Streptomyces aidingensis TaxID=910347 RepID=A0A1I1JEE6_9ACTN|nr:PAS domain S-box-containing protein/diguanylate cyclase (GGDEF) domain-containing protein [Streptomyces aidingensis]